MNAMIRIGVPQDGPSSGNTSSRRASRIALRYRAGERLAVSLSSSALAGAPTSPVAQASTGQRDHR